MGIYRLGQTDVTVRLATVLFLLVLGYGYIFAFLMVKTSAGLTPAAVEETYAPSAMLNESSLPEESQSTTEAINLAKLATEKHQISDKLLIQDSHIHIIMYAIIAALESLIIFGLEWGALFRNIMVIAAFGAGALDFSGQWLMKFGISGFAWTTILSGWLMALVCAVILVRTI